MEYGLEIEERCILKKAKQHNQMIDITVCIKNVKVAFNEILFLVQIQLFFVSYSNGFET